MKITKERHPYCVCRQFSFRNNTEITVLIYDKRYHKYSLQMTSKELDNLNTEINISGHNLRELFRELRHQKMKKTDKNYAKVTSRIFAKNT